MTTIVKKIEIEPFVLYCFRYHSSRMFSKELHFDLNRLDSNSKLLAVWDRVLEGVVLDDVIAEGGQHLKQKTKTQRDTSKNNKNLSKLH